MFRNENESPEVILDVLREKIANASIIMGNIKKKFAKKLAIIKSTKPVQALAHLGSKIGGKVFGAFGNKMCTKNGIVAETGKKKALTTPVYILSTCGSNDPHPSTDQTIFPNYTQIFGADPSTKKDEYYYPITTHTTPTFVYGDVKTKIKGNSIHFHEEISSYDIYIRKTMPEYNDVIQIAVNCGHDGRIESPALKYGRNIPNSIYLFVDAEDYRKLDVNGFVKMVLDDADKMRESGKTIYDLAAQYPVIWNKAGDKEIFSIYKKGDADVSYFTPPNTVCFSKQAKTKSGNTFSAKTRTF